MSSLLYIDANNIQHVIPNVKLGSLTGFEGSTGTIETISNADYTAVLKTRISRKERIISLTIPVRGTSADDLEAKESAYLTMFAQTDAPGILRYTRNDGTARETAVCIADGYPVRTAETNTFSWIDVKFVACSPYWTDTNETEIIHNTAFENDGDYPAECRLTLNRTVNQITLDGDVIMKFRNGGMMMTHYVTITDNAITATDTSGNNALYKFTLSSKFDLIPTGTHTISGCKGTFRKRWGHA